MSEVNKDDAPTKRKSLTERIKESTRQEEERLSQLFDEQAEEIKEYLIKNRMYSINKPETENFVELIDKYRDAHIAQELLVGRLENQRVSINTNSTLLNNLVDTKVIHETLTYVLRELRAVDEDGYLLEKHERL